MLRRALGLLGTGAFKARVLPQLAEAAVTEVRNGFRRAVDPYGVPWLPLKWRRGRPLLDTGVLRNSFSGRVQGDGLAVASPVRYASFHQEGARLARRAGWMAHGSGGRFIARDAASRRRAGAVRVSWNRGGSGSIPARPMVPDARGLPDRWARTFEGIAKKTVSAIMAGG